MITITNLTSRQRLLADLIWQCDSMEQAVSLVGSLQGQDRRDAQALMQCMIYEVLEEQLDEYADQARSVISSCRY